MSDPTPSVLAIGSIFQGRYEVVRCIKSGGMGAVYEAVQLETRRRRALKVMLPQVVADAGLRSRFRAEATVTAAIESDHIVETLDAGVDEATGAPYLVMELLRGQDLSELIHERGRVSPEEAIVFLAQLALALDKTHAAGIVHRDLKPENLFVTWRDDGSPRLKVLDFGIAKVVAQAGKTGKHTLGIGTPLYMAPEQVRAEGSIGPATDLNAVAHIAYVLLVGEPYWEEDAQRADSVYGILLAIGDGTKEAASARAQRTRGVELSPEFDAWFAKATAADPRGRFDGAGEMVAALALALDVEAPRLTVVPAGRSSQRSMPTDPTMKAPPPTALLEKEREIARSPLAESSGRERSASVAQSGRSHSTSAIVSDPRPGRPLRARRIGIAAFAAVATLALAGLALRARTPEADAPSAGTAPPATTAAPSAVVATRPDITVAPAPADPPTATATAASSASAAATPTATAVPSTTPKAPPIGRSPLPKTPTPPSAPPLAPPPPTSRGID